MNPFRLHHLQTILQALFSTPIGETNRVANYFSQHRALGSKDRQWISSRVFQVLRHHRLLTTLIQEDSLPVNPDTFIAKIEEGVLDDIEQFSHLPWPVRYSISDDLAESLCQDYDEAYVQELAKIFLEEAPTFIRVNTKKISVPDLQQMLNFPSDLGEAPGSLRFEKRYPLQHTAAFHRGLFEIQDLSSQQITQALPITKKDVVLDFCAGAGGKSLILAQKAKHIVLYDSRESILQTAKQRLLRSGSHNFSLGKNHLKKNHFSVVVVDAPCSSSGVFRRQPEKKGTFTSSLLKGCVYAQRKIVKEASMYLKPGGLLVYITCSLLSDENERQADYMQSLGLEVINSTKIPLCSKGGDGFFSFLLKKR